MNRFLHAAIAAALMTGGFGSIGCTNTDARTSEGHEHEAGSFYRSFVDPCHLPRWSATAREETLDPFRKQVNNGEILNQTIYNYYFELGTDKISLAGIEKLDSIARSRPAPDPKIYIQTARDLVVTPENMDKITEQRIALDAKRAAAIQKYLSTEPAFQYVAYEIYVHDPLVPAIDSNFAGSTYRGMAAGYRGGISGGAGGVQGTGGGGGFGGGAPTGGAGGGAMSGSSSGPR